MILLLAVAHVSYVASCATPALRPSPSPSGLDKEWSGLDREIDALQASTSAVGGGPHLDGFLRIRGAYSNDVDAGPAPGDQDLSGFTLDNIRIGVWGEPREGWTWRVNIEAGHQAELDTFAGPGVDLIDAYTIVQMCPSSSLTVGYFCSNFLWSACNEERNLLFLDRSFIAENWDGRDVGAQLRGKFEAFEAWVAVQNGFDGKEHHQAYTGRVAYHAWGEGEWCCEGSCFGGGDRLTIGAAAFEDRMMDHGSALAADALFVQGRWSAHGEIAKYGSDMRTLPGVDPSTGAIVPVTTDPTGSEIPWDFTLGFAVVPDAWELAARFQDLDDDNDTSVASLALDRYLGARAIKWTLQFDHSQSDDSVLEVDVLGVGLTVAF